MLTLLTLLFACGDAQTDDTGEPNADSVQSSPHCDETSSAIDRDDDSAIGIPASNLLDALPYAVPEPLSWADGASDALTWQFEADESTLRFVESEAVYPDTNGPQPAIEVLCYDYIAIDGVLSVSTDDGRLAESEQIILALYGGGNEASEGPLAIVSHDLDHTALTGTLDLGDFDDTDGYDSLTLSIGGEIYFATEEVTFVGQLRALGESSDGNTAMAYNIDIAEWSPSALD